MKSYKEQLQLKTARFVSPLTCRVCVGPYIPPSLKIISSSKLTTHSGQKDEDILAAFLTQVPRWRLQVDGASIAL